MITCSRNAHEEAAAALPDGIRLTRFCDVSILTVSSTTTTGQTVDAFITLLRARRTPRLLWDLRARSLAQLPAEALRAMVSKMMLEAPRQRPGGRSAFVVSAEADSLVLQMLILHAEAAGYSVRLAVFRDDRSALDWLFGRA